MVDALQMLKSAESDSRWFSDHLSRIKEDFGGKIVAIKDKEIVASGESFEDVEAELTREGIDKANTLIERVVESGKYIIR